MDFSGRDVFKFLRNKGADALYHADTVATALSHLKAGGLISRAFAERRQLTQTGQKSDAQDQRHDVWHDIFIDPVDIHYRARIANIYGPVLFKLDLKLLLWPCLGVVRITRSNPLTWKDNQSSTKRYFDTLTAAATTYQYGDFAIMFTIRDGLQPIPFDQFLKEVTLDNPARPSAKSQLLHTTAKRHLARAAKQLSAPPKSIPFVDYACREHCKCKDNYKALEFKEVRKRFATSAGPP